MKEFNPDYRFGRSDNVKRLKRQLESLHWWEFKVKRIANNFIRVASITDAHVYSHELLELSRKKWRRH